MKNQREKPTSYTDRNQAVGEECGKIPPQDADVEKVLLGTLLAFPESAGKVAHLLESRMFYRQAHGEIYGAAITLHSRNEPVDVLTVSNALRASGKLEDAGGVSYLMQLTTPVLSDFHVETHAAIVFEKFIQREIIRISAEAIDAAFAGETDMEDLFAGVERQMTVVGEMIAGKRKSRDLREILADCMTEAWQRHENYRRGAANGVSSGFCDLDKILNGWQNSDFIILAARPSMGKTAIALKFVRAAAASGVPVALFSLEMKDTQLAHRMILAGADIDAGRYASGNTSSEEMQKAEASAGRICDFPVSIDHNSGVTMSYIRTQAKVLKKQGKCGLIVIDYLQLIREEHKSNRNREQAMSAISNECKTLAKELDVPVIALSQLNRKSEKRADRKPILADLRDSGAIEQDADVVIFVHRPEKYGAEVTDANGNTIEHYGELIVSKNRNGALGDVKFTHNGSMTEFYDYDRYGYRNFYESHANPFQP